MGRIYSRKVYSEVLPGVWEITFALLVVSYLPQVRRVVTFHFGYELSQKLY